MAPEPPGAVRLPCAGGLVRLTGPGRVTKVLAESLSTLSIPSEALPVLEITLSPDARTADGIVDGRPMWSIALPAGALVGTLLGQVVGTLTTLLTRLLFVHAGVVAFDGRGMILVGESGAGKTSTVAALVRRGATYLSDEVALLDPEAGVVIPFTLPMAVKPWTRRAAGVLPPGRTVHRERGVDLWFPQRLDPAPALVEVFILLDHGGQEARLKPLSRGAMLLALARHASSFKQQHRVNAAFAGFAQLLRSARTMVFETPRPAAHADLLVAIGRRSS
jgi:hypothetical protein